MPEPESICRNCGAANPRGNNFCGRCGAFVGVPAPAEQGPRPVVARPGDRRVRRLAFIVYGIAAFFLLSCAILTLVVIIWRP